MGKKHRWANQWRRFIPPEIINPYITEISKFLSQVESNTIVDLGCGDQCWKNFVPTKKYIACDVSNVILNKIKYNSFSNLEFKFLDLSEDPLPKGDVCFVRQDLQHLSNENINKFVKNKFRKSYKHIVVTEYLTQNDNFIANLDKSVGANTEHMVGSGVVLHEEPFN